MTRGPDKPEPPGLPEIRAARERLGRRVRLTPVWQWRGGAIEAALGEETRVFLKLELFQFAGSFKPRGALANMLALSPDEFARGVTTVSAGNHAMATAYAARALGSSAKVVMPRSASPARVAAARAYGAEIVLVGELSQLFDTVKQIEHEEQRAFIHPYEGVLTITGTATLGLELLEQLPELDAVVVPIGGGGLCAGVASAVKQLRPGCRVYGVEPEGADTMHRSFASGRPESLEEVRTIADSLAAPHCTPMSFGLCRRFVDQLVLIDDASMCRAMGLLFRDMKLAVEPAGAASTAALLGPLHDELRGKRVALIVCGSNIDLETFTRQVSSEA
ncbi:MAG: threonine/serine dehydratase [Planctomycetota bacterium]